MRTKSSFWVGLAAAGALSALAPAQQGAGATLAVAPAPGVAAGLLAEAGELLGQRRAAEAWALLSPREAELAGYPQYDYLLGIAALDSGRPAEAVFTLERLLAAQPGFDGARMELARALFESGDLEGARTQFGYLRTRTPPAATAQIIDRYLAAIDRGVGGRRHEWTAFVEGGGGWDSNANASTSDDSFLGFDLDPRNIESDSWFLDGAAGLQHRAGYGNGLFSDAGLRGYYRTNPDARFVDQAIVSANANLYRQSGPWRLQGGLSAWQAWRDGSRNEHSLGLTASLARAFASRWEWRLQGSAGPLRYDDDALEVLDVDRYLGALSLTRFHGGARAGRLTASLLAGKDAERRAGSPYGNSRVGLRAGGEFALGPRSLAFFQAGWLNADYDDSPGFFGGQDRDDDQYTLLAGVELRDWPAADWSLAPRLRYVRQDSSISLYEYDRVEVAVTLRRAFRPAADRR